MSDAQAGAHEAPDAARLVVALSGSPRAGSNTDILTDTALLGAKETGAETVHLRARDVRAIPCQACGPDPTGGHGYCIYHDDMDRVYELLERATGVLVASPVFFSGLSAQLKLVIDRTNCVTPAVEAPDGSVSFRRQWPRTRRGGLILVLGPDDTPEPSRLTARGFLSWIGGRLLETLVYRHRDIELGAVARDSEWLARARALGASLAGPPLVPGPSASSGGTGSFHATHPGLTPSGDSK
ncbi:MAG: flavodoxin family protein [Candidatus Eiseniibacteriota bacterium]